MAACTLSAPNTSAPEETPYAHASGEVLQMTTTYTPPGTRPKHSGGVTWEAGGIVRAVACILSTRAAASMPSPCSGLSGDASQTAAAHRRGSDANQGGEDRAGRERGRRKRRGDQEGGRSDKRGSERVDGENRSAGRRSGYSALSGRSDNAGNDDASGSDSGDGRNSLRPILSPRLSLKQQASEDDDKPDSKTAETAKTAETEETEETNEQAGKEKEADPTSCLNFDFVVADREVVACESADSQATGGLQSLDSLPSDPLLYPQHTAGTAPLTLQHDCATDPEDVTSLCQFTSLISPPTLNLQHCTSRHAIAKCHKHQHADPNDQVDCPHDSEAACHTAEAPHASAHHTGQCVLQQHHHANDDQEKSALRQRIRELEHQVACQRYLPPEAPAKTQAQQQKASDTREKLLRRTAMQAEASAERAATSLISLRATLRFLRLLVRTRAHWLSCTSWCAPSCALLPSRCAGCEKVMFVCRASDLYLVKDASTVCHGCVCRCGAAVFYV